MNAPPRPEWAMRTFTSFDTETTGVNVEEDRIVTASVLTLDPVARSSAQEEWLIDPGVEIPEGATKVHGITTEQARARGQCPADALAGIRDALHECWDSGQVLVIYNAPYDLTIFDRELRRHGLPAIGTVGPVYDPLVIDKQVNKYVRGKGARKLMPTCARYGITLTEQEAHSSSGDALAAGRLMYKQSTHPQVRGIPLGELNDRQAMWYRAQQESFAEYKARQGPEGEEDAERIREEAARGYPLRTFVDEMADQAPLPPW